MSKDQQTSKSPFYHYPILSYGSSALLLGYALLRGAGYRSRFYQYKIGGLGIALTHNERQFFRLDYHPIKNRYRLHYHFGSTKAAMTRHRFMFP